ncbi:hypothetical protein B0H13DRAFT_2268352 [Mycena leptocephala]|nr:hypothetical protein B0H13DRAFT_2268352 [Mycena leptocephala]
MSTGFNQQVECRQGTLSVTSDPSECCESNTNDGSLSRHPFALGSTTKTDHKSDELMLHDNGLKNLESICAYNLSTLAMTSIFKFPECCALVQTSQKFWSCQNPPGSVVRVGSGSKAQAWAGLERTWAQKYYGPDSSPQLYRQVCVGLEVYWSRCFPPQEVMKHFPTVNSLRFVELKFHQPTGNFRCVYGYPLNPKVMRSKTEFEDL